MDNLQEGMNEEEKTESFYSKKKKLVWLLIIVILFIIIGSIIVGGNGNKGGREQSTNIMFDSNVESIMIGSAKRITASIIDNPIYEVRYHSSDESIIAVDKYGLVEGISSGTANLKAYYFDANGKEHYIERKITVFEGNSKIKITSAVFPEGEIVLKLYGEYNLGNKLIVTPSSGYIDSKVFKSSNEEVVTVSSSGKLVGVSEGEAIINVKVNNTFDSNIRVYVSKDAASSEIVKLPESIVFDNVSLKLKVGELKSIGYNLKPDNAVDRFLNWVSSDQTVAIVDNGVLTAVGEGNCDITLSSINGKSAKLFVEVIEPINVEKISFNESSIVLKENGTYKLTPVVEPKGAIDRKLTFTSDDDKVAKIEVANDSSATIRAISEGKSIIRVRSSNGVTASIKVSVTTKDSKDVSDDNGTIAVRINDNISPAKVYSDDIQYTNPANITISKSGSVETVKYCYAPYSNAICTPNLEYKNSFSIPSGSIYRLRVQKFDAKGKEIIGSNSDNYRNGALEYYINTGSSDYYKDVGYTITGTHYKTVTEANDNVVNKNVRLDFKFINTVTDKLKICYTTGNTCDPDNNPNLTVDKNSNKFLELKDDGLWKIYVSEYSNNNKVGTTKKYYVNILNNGSGYLINGKYYYTALDASNNSVSESQRLTFNLNSKIDKIKICLSRNGSCNPVSSPDKIITGNTVSNFIDITGSGLWRIHVAEYDNNDEFISERVYYLSIK